MSDEDKGPELSRRRLMQLFGAGGALAAAPISVSGGAAASGAAGIKALGDAMFVAVKAALDAEALAISAPHMSTVAVQQQATMLSTQMQPALKLLAENPGATQHAIESLFLDVRDTQSVVAEVHSLFDGVGIDLELVKSPADVARFANEFYNQTIRGDKSPSEFERLNKLFDEDGSVLSAQERLRVMLNGLENAQVIPKGEPRLDAESTGDMSWVIRGDNPHLLQWISEQLPILLPGTDTSVRAGQMIVYPRLRPDHESQNAKTLYETMEALVSAHPEQSRTGQISM